MTINISKLFNKKVDEKLIVLGGSSGLAFIGNTKYLYYYLKENTDYKLLYFTKSPDLKKKLESIGIKTISAYSIKGIKTLRRARFVFVTHGLNDVVHIRFSPKTTFIETWHGILNKKYININETLEYSKWANALRLKVKNDDIIDYFVTTSEEKKNMNIITRNFLIPSKKIIVSGYPRNDLFFLADPNLPRSIKKRFNIPEKFERIYLNAPTFRDNVLKAEFPLSKNELLELNEHLIKTNSLLLLKPHKSEQEINLKAFSNIIIVNKNIDIQELLFITDVLITDYSSVYCDFLLLKRPILFFTYDYDYFCNVNRGLIYNLKEMAPGPLLYTSKELIDAIKNISIISNEYKTKLQESNNSFNKHQDGKSTERLLKFLKII